MIEVTCEGTPYEVGVQHGTAAKEQIKRGIAFYESLFQERSKMSWDQVTPWAEKYVPYLRASWPDYVSEMEGIAAGSTLPFLSILALNVRTEIAFGAFSDGCTAISWRGHSTPTSLLAQNWDWSTTQAVNLISLKLFIPGRPRIHMITEAGIIGKIGLNEKGVGCTLNAIKAKGVDFAKLPCHLALRTVLESSSRQAAIAALEKSGVASACHILIADSTGGTGLECSSEDIVPLPMSKDGIVTHTNHYIAKHAEAVVEAHDWVPDTKFRLSRIRELVGAATKEEEPSVGAVERMLRDEMEEEGPKGAAINRREKKSGDIATLFSVIMDLRAAKGRVVEGRPTEPIGFVELLP